ncbi:MAG: HAMP domain-containing histidine kinase [Bacteroidales bacterium]|jgi:signal transduction histidine kinase|nr:HAMP domain-containing histidine kinase [Bacteroidales bacterium]MDD3735984.1 HAMP domain-containing sensor histidine kinase [Bacteroidales bacterium]HOO65746.1 HAMP domain-containing sensor histidine kinase [Bacteroidales bacterium]HPE22025.1 HAMP domain-containing sensor histidine kinase [Bacteroidales bacterium]HPJ04568.1 HAMP domain-containing sensor histidine kinase [Bacteroidales bacterium]
MKRKLLLTVSLVALLLFMAVQLFMIRSTWQQKEEILFMRYKSLSREGLSLLLSKKKNYGFEKAMDVADKFADYLITEELYQLYTFTDSAHLRHLALKETYSIMEENEMLTSFLKYYIGNLGYENNFRPVIAIAKLELLTPPVNMVLVDTVYSQPGKNMVIVNTFREERNHFILEFHYLLDLTHKNEMVLREALLSFVLITGSILIVFLVFGLTWRNLMEERRLSELKSDFINNMTHELKTPLSTITVAGRTLEKEQIITDRDRVLETARMIGKQSVHLNQLINTILEVSFLEREEFELDRHKVVIDELLHQVVTSFLTSCDGCAEIKEDYSINGMEASVDIVYFTTMISNLLSNAVKYCDGDPVISVKAAATGNDIEITVADNGVGIPAEHLGHIFEKFYRVPHGNIHKTKGLGLGLYYVRRIATAHGGDVTVNSKQGRGTTFRIRIPIQKTS